MNKISQKILRILPITSIILGIIGITWGHIPFNPFLSWELRASLFATGRNLLYLRIFIPGSLIGLTVGILSLKLKLGKIKAILGIIFSSIALLIWLFIWFWITGWSVGA